MQIQDSDSIVIEQNNNKIGTLNSELVPRLDGGVVDWIVDGARLPLEDAIGVGQLAEDERRTEPTLGSPRHT